MNTPFYNQVATCTAHRKPRELIRDYCIENPIYISQLVEIACNTKDKNHIKACWILEMICEEQLSLFVPFIDKFSTSIADYKSDSAIRSISKICLFLTKSKKIRLNKIQEEKIIETGLDWLIQTKKAANAAYTMRFLYILGKKYSWVNEELILLLSREFSDRTPGYRFAVKDILKKITS